MDIKKTAEEIMSGGPDRVVINSSGEATSFKRARSEYSVNPDIIFIRKDGWSLGAPRHLEKVAYEIWKDAWEAFMVRPEIEAQDITEYKEK